MLLVKFNGQQAVKYPYTLDELYVDNPGVYFPNLTNETLLPFKAASVVVTGAPAHDPNTQAAEPNGCAYNEATGRWETQWSIRALTAAEMQKRLADLQKSIVAQTQKRLDDFAKTRNYDGILSACTYATSSVFRFQMEGQHCVNSRDSTWSALYTVLAEVQSGARPMPSDYADIEPLLPVLEWPV